MKLRLHDRFPTRNGTRSGHLVKLMAGFFLLAVNSQAQHEPNQFAAGPGIEIRLFAREPMVVDPVALSFDEAGRMYVIEMRDYPSGMGPNHEPGGTIRLLEDTNDDGEADRATLFADGLSVPTSILCWEGGVFVTAPPEILYLKDTNGDGKADVRKIVFKGLVKGVTDSNANGLRLGLDNQIHVNNGGNGGKLFRPEAPDTTLELENFDFSFDPHTFAFRKTFHSTAGFGLVFDNWGRSFGTYNINHVQQRVFPADILEKGADLKPFMGTMSISDHEEMAKIYPLSRPETRVNHPEQSGHFSSAGGVGIIGNPDFGEDLAGSILIGDVVGNLIHRDILKKDGPVFKATRGAKEQASEFIASRDNACRLVGFEMGPDGGLYVIDMQRDVIEHPDYIPEVVKSKLNLRAGEDRGRIYRVFPTTKQTRKRVFKGLTSSELIDLLSDKVSWTRTTAHRLLLEKQDPLVVPALEKVAMAENTSRLSTELARVHALWLLKSFNALEAKHIFAALNSGESGVRENALILSAGLGAANSAQVVERASNDPDAMVRFQLALLLARLDIPGKETVLTKIYETDFMQKPSRQAVLLAMPRGETKFFERALALVAEKNESNEIVAELGDYWGCRTKSSQDLLKMLSILEKKSWTEETSISFLREYKEGIARSGITLETETGVLKPALDHFAAKQSEGVKSMVALLGATLKIQRASEQAELIKSAVRSAMDAEKSVPARIAGLELAGLSDQSTNLIPLIGLFSTSEQKAFFEPAIKVLKRGTDPVIARQILQLWGTVVPEAKSPLLNLLLSKTTWHDSLLEALESGQVTVGELNLDLEQRRTLLRESTPDIARRAGKFIQDEEYSNRNKIVSEWLAKLPEQGNQSRGAAIFERTCMQCHFHDGKGKKVGPDLSEMAHRSVEDLASNILDPNMAINPLYVTYAVETTDNESISGILKSKTSKAITLLQAQEITTTVLTKNIKSGRFTGTSLMPTGLEQTMTPQELRDLIAYLQRRDQ